MAASGWALIAVAPFVGSFLGVVIRRLPRQQPYLLGRSHCVHCGAALGIRDLVPFVSWAAARACCRSCGARLGWFYPAVEAAALVIAVLSASLDHGVAAWIDFALGCWLLALAWIDFDHLLLPDALTLPLVLAGLAQAAALAPDELFGRAAGAACGFVSLAVLAWAYRRSRGREGLGGGDPKLLAAAGAWVGIAALPAVILVAAVTGLAAAAGLALGGAALRRDTAVPFGPFLALATWAVWLFGAPGF